MKKPVALLSLVAMVVVPSAALADGDGVVNVPMITIYGKRPARPNVIIELTRPTAAQAAGAAHESLRDDLLKASMPAALKAAEAARDPK